MILWKLAIISFRRWRKYNEINEKLFHFFFERMEIKLLRFLLSILSCFGLKTEQG